MGKWPNITSRMVLTARAAKWETMSFSAEYNANFTRNLILFEIFRMGGHCQFEEVTSATSLTLSTISKQMKRMAEQGYVQCTVNPEDSRKRFVTLLPQGEECSRTVLDNFALGEKTLCRNLSEKENRELLRYLKIFYKNIRYDAELPENYFEEDCRIMEILIMTVNRLESISLQYNKADGIRENGRYILVQMSRNENAVSFKKIEKMVLLGQSGTVKQMKKLEDGGFVECFTDPTDRRVKKAKLTVKGQEKAQVCLKRILVEEERGCIGLNEQDRQRFCELLDKLQENLKLTAK